MVSETLADLHAELEGKERRNDVEGEAGEGAAQATMGLAGVIGMPRGRAWWGSGWGVGGGEGGDEEAWRR